MQNALLFLSLPIYLAAPAAAQNYDHPLLTPEAAQLIAQIRAENPSWSSEQILAELEIADLSDADGLPEKKVRRVQRSPIPGHTGSRKPELPTRILGPVIERWLMTNTVPLRPVTLWLRIHPEMADGPTFHQYLRELMVDGTQLLEYDIPFLRQSHRAARVALGQFAMTSLRQYAVELGATVLDEVPARGLFKVRLPAHKLRALLNHHDLFQAHRATRMEEDAGEGYTVDGPWVDGRELENLLQTTQFYDEGIYGHPIERIAIVEPAGDIVKEDHQGLASLFGSSRFINCGDSGFGCDFAQPVTGGSHSTASASVALGNITFGQDPAITTDLEQRQRSGVARENGGIGLSDSNVSFLESQVLQHNVYVLSHSASNYSIDELCEGEDAISCTFNYLYEEGVASFNSAGNRGHADTNDCKVGSPGSAIGVYSVGAYKVNLDDEEVVYDGSSRGGTSTEGKGRTVVGGMAPSRFEYPYPHYRWPLDTSLLPYEYGTDWDNLPGPPNAYARTSSAAPALAGSASLFRHWYTHNVSRSIDDPGRLYTAMMLMSDRTTELGKSVNYFDGVWGAGKLRLRKLNNAGLDGPAWWRCGEICVDDGTNVFLNLPPLSGDEDVIKAVIWWYDRRHEWGMPGVDDIDLTLQLQSGSNWFDVLVSESSDNRERIHYTAPGAGTYRLKIRGESVTTSFEGCWLNSMRVYYSYLIEDSDREAWEGLQEVRPE